MRLGIGDGFLGGLGAPTKALNAAIYAAAAAGAPSWGGGAADGRPRMHVVSMIGEWGTTRNCGGCGLRNGDVAARASNKVWTREIHARWEAAARATQRAEAGLPLEKARKERNVDLHLLHGLHQCPHLGCPFYGRCRERDGGSGAAQSIRGNSISVARTGQLQRTFRQGAKIEAAGAPRVLPQPSGE